MCQLKMNHTIIRRIPHTDKLDDTTTHVFCLSVYAYVRDSMYIIYFCVIHVCMHVYMYV